MKRKNMIDRNTLDRVKTLPVRARSQQPSVMLTAHNIII